MTDTFSFRSALPSPLDVYVLIGVTPWSGNETEEVWNPTSLSDHWQPFRLVKGEKSSCYVNQRGNRRKKYGRWACTQPIYRGKTITAQATSFIPCFRAGSVSVFFFPWSCELKVFVREGSNSNALNGLLRPYPTIVSCLLSAEVRKVGSASLVYQDLVVAEGSPLVRLNWILYNLRYGSLRYFLNSLSGPLKGLSRN